MRIYIPCYSRDKFLAAATLHSIRMFSTSKVDITLIPDSLENDDFIQLISDAYHAQILYKHDLNDSLSQRCHGGWGFSKLLPFFNYSDDSFLCIDADCIAIGDLTKIAGQLNNHSFVSDLNRVPPTVDEHFFSLGDPLISIPENRLPILRRRFVSGIFASKAGVIQNEILERIIDISQRPNSPLFPGDQGILNYWAIVERPDSIPWISLHMQVYACSLKCKKNVCSPQEKLCAELSSIIDESIFRDHVLNRNLYPFVLHYAGATKPFIGVGEPSSPLMNRFRRWSNQYLGRRFAWSTRLQLLIDDIKVTKGLPLKHLARKPWKATMLHRWF